MASKSYELRVKVVKIDETQEFASGFKKRELEAVLEGEYPENFKFEFIKDKVDLLDDILEGTYATISFNIKGRKVENDKDGNLLQKPMFFTTLQGWKIEA